MQDYQDIDPTQEDLYNQIQNLIVDTSSNIHNDYLYEQDHHFEQYDDEYDEEQVAKHVFQQGQEEEEEEEEEFVYERPILVESDSDEQDEEEITTPGPYSGNSPQHQSLCYECNQPLTYEERRRDTLTVDHTVMLCTRCSTFNAMQLQQQQQQQQQSNNKKKKKKRSLSFTSESGVFNQFTDKIVNFLTPSKSMDRRKSMSSVQPQQQQQQQQKQKQRQLEIPTPIDTSIGRPSSRASSIIEDVKQFLSPLQGALSRRSSRNSLYDDFNNQKEPQRKTSHTSLLDAFNLCKPKPKQQTAFERRGFVDYTPDNEYYAEDDDARDQTNYLVDLEPYVPIRRKQIKQVDSTRERINIYDRAFAECMESQTNLLPWIVKQSQKGPPDAYFGYTPPERKPKKILGVFKVKSKPREDMQQQQQLGIDISRITTPLRHQSSALSVSPSHLTSSPFNNGEYLKPDAALLESAVVLEDHVVSTEKPNTPNQPVSILKKKKSSSSFNNNNNNQDYYDYMSAPFVDAYEQEEEEGDYEVPEEPIYRKPSFHSGILPTPPGTIGRNGPYDLPHRSSRTSLYNDYYQPPAGHYRTSTPQMHHPDDFYYRPRGYFSTRDHMPPSSRQQHRYYDDDIEEYDDIHEEEEEEEEFRRRYYGNNIMTKMTPLRMEEWENSLDTLSDEFPRLDRGYLNDFLRSAQGDFVTAKNMVLEMIMESDRRRPIY